MNDRNNTIAGWVLFAGIVALGGSIATGEYFNHERPEKMGYPIEGVVEEGAGAAAAEKPIAFYLASATADKGMAVFKKCQACHNADKGGANALGPNLWGVLGEPVGQGKGFAFSDALAKKGGNWNFDLLSTWLTNPKAFAPGTKMTFAGLSNPEDRANVIAYLNAQSDHPQPMPAVPADTAAAAPAGTGNGANPPSDAKAAAEVKNGGDAQKAKDQPVLTEQQAASGPNKSIAGEAAPAVSGASDQQKKK
ncbi:cytochrome c family protein [Sphingomonas ginkgonis]|uniref:Cytochrome c family protein n=1 Tax=Sphingomonas ginkgonis TaxID=2315330 RepID=A0A3R9X6H6_9SPHN|nr:cytochrome c family protein [Sphingomonas ginkgonis]RST29950.1 cytochrome c family protein [Sphingomonas ginkgonis]